MVNVFIGEDEVVGLHEESSERQFLSPDFDCNAIIVLLKRI